MGHSSFKETYLRLLEDKINVQAKDEESLAFFVLLWI